MRNEGTLTGNYRQDKEMIANEGTMKGNTGK